MKSLEEKVQSFFENGFVSDAHCDTLLKLSTGECKFKRRNLSGHLDLPRMEEGRVALQFFAAFIGSSYKPEQSLKRALQLIDVFYQEVINGATDIEIGLSYTQIKRIINKRQKKIAILAIEGGEALSGDLGVLRLLYRLGVRSIGLTWNQRNELADGVWERESRGGLTRFGKETIREMNRLGMVVDLAHISETGFWDAIRTSEKPVMVSHANCRFLCNHPRNLTNDQIKGIAAHKGVVGLTFAPEFLGSEMDMEAFLKHIDHVAGLIGTNYIVIGSDFDGIDITPDGLEDASKLPRLAVALLERGYTLDEVNGIMGKNLIDYLARVL